MKKIFEFSKNKKKVEKRVKKKVKSKHAKICKKKITPIFTTPVFTPGTYFYFFKYYVLFLIIIKYTNIIIFLNIFFNLLNI